jgi:23S rRNA (pseudouridine1915-N3)-methyltransferase
MKLHIVTIGEPKLVYARTGWDEYLARLKRFHAVQVTHVADKRARDAAFLLQTAGSAYKIALAVEGKQLSSPQLAEFLERRAQEGRELCFIIGGPEGLPQAVVDAADMQWSLSKLTFPHDLAMVVLLETLYRASTIAAGQPYHK